MLKGLVTIVVRDSSTLEEIARYEQTNIITNQMFNDLSQGGTIPKVVGASTHRYSPSIFTEWIALGNSTTFSGDPIPGKGAPDFFPATESTEMYAQWCTRIVPIATSRTINTIFLSNTVPSATWSYRNQQIIRAYMKLSSPCIQTNTQVLDVYYRIYFPESNRGNRSKSTYTAMAQRLCNDPTLAGPIGSLYHSTSPNELPMPQFPAEYTGRIVGTNWKMLLGNPNTMSSTKTYKRKYAQTLDLVSTNGTILYNLITLSRDGQVVTATSPINVPYIQNVIGHAANAPGPFLDVDSLPSSTGSVIPSGNWSPVQHNVANDRYSDGSFSKMRRININETGAVGTATYNVSEYPFFGTAIIDTAVQGDNWAHRMINIPFFSTDYNVPDTVRFPINNFGVRQLSAVTKYKSTSVIVPLNNKLIIYNIATGNYWEYAGAYTNIHQIAVLNDDIYFACSDTGLWKINPNTDSTPSQVIPPNNMDLSRCYGVAIGNNSSLFCVGTNGLLKMQSNNWSIFNESSTPTLSFAGITDNNWSNIEYLKIDASSIDNKMLLVKTRVSVDTTYALGIWWSETTNASLAPTESPNGSGLDPLVYHGSGWNKLLGRPRTNRSHINVSPNGTMWVVNCNNNLNYMTFGSNISTIIDNTRDYWCGSVMFITNALGLDRLLVMKRSSMYSSILNTSIVTYAPCIIGPNNVVEYSGQTDATCHGTFVDSMASTTNPLTISSGIYGGKDNQVSFMMDGGVIFALHRVINSYDQTLMSAAIGQIALDSHGSGPLQHLAIQQYGWDGSNWVLGSTNSKLTHSDSQPLHDNVSISFINGSTGTSFVKSDFFTFGLCAGLLKDNATVTTLEQSHYFKRAYNDFSELSSNTIPVHRAGNTGLMQLDLARSSSVDISVGNNNTFKFAEKNGNQVAVGNIQLIGDFSIMYNISADPARNNTMFGIGFSSSNLLLAGFGIDNNGIIYVSCLSSFTNDNSDRVERASLVNPATGWSTPLGNTSTVNTLGIIVTGGNITFRINDMYIPMSSSSSASTPIVKLLPGYTRYDAFGTPVAVFDSNYTASGQLIPIPNVVSNGSDNAIKIGSSSSGSGAYNPKFFCIDADIMNGITGDINGVPFTNVSTDGTAPIQGGIAVSPYTGSISFHPADEQLPVSLKCTYITHE